jgi:ketosteroid isomerase-like protein
MRPIPSVHRQPAVISAITRPGLAARRFFAAADGGDPDGLLRALAPDVVYFGDGGGKARAVAAPPHGRDRVARFLAGLFRRIRNLEASFRIVEANGQPGAVTYDRDGHVVNVFALDIADGAVQAIRCVVNPDKLRHLDELAEVVASTTHTEALTT